MPPLAPAWVEDVWYRLHRRAGDGEQEWIGSANLAVLREAFDAEGGFDERLVTGEDTALCQRLRDRGCRIYESKRLTAVHLDNAKTVGDFYRKELWRGLGMLGTLRAGAIDKPTATLAYRVRGGGNVAHPLRGLLLYEVYYAARAAALARLLFRRPKA